jgi:hypothetical protein
MIDSTWIAEQIAGSRPCDDTSAVVRLWGWLEQLASGFARDRGLATATLIRPSRRLLADESASFLRAVEAGFILVDPSGFFTLPHVRAKTPRGRYALFSKNGDGVALNLEYLVQAGATAELVFDHGWPASDVDFERGEFDALTHGPDGRVALAMEAKARMTGADSLEKLLMCWLRFAADSEADLNSNAGRKWRELTRLCVAGPVVVWLVADGARWTLRAEVGSAGIVLSTAPGPERRDVLARSATAALTSMPYAAEKHRPGTWAASGGCSWHGRTCANRPVVSFQDAQGRLQAGCERAVRDMVARGDMMPLSS